jgi:predicted metalloprotease with PDZ domain
MKRLLPVLIALSFVGGAGAAPLPASSFAGAITLSVDTTDVDHQVFWIEQTIPIQQPGPVTLLYPRWESGSHAPTATVNELAGLQVDVGGVPVTWRRDPIDTHAFHVDAPAGARTLHLRMQFLAAPAMALLHPDMTLVPWHRLLLYPQGWPASAIPVVADLKLPADLAPASALPIAGRDGDRVRFGQVPLDRLVDTPVYAARHHRSIALGTVGAAPVTLELLADAPADMDVAPPELERLRKLPIEAEKIFGRPPFAGYRALLTLSDRIPGPGGNEHLEEAEVNLPENYFTDPTHQLPSQDLIAHEFVHAWNGVYRRPAALWSADYNSPVQTGLLWVYEGQTEFWARTLAARSGMRTLQESLDKLADDAALVAHRPGRAWKNLADSLNDPLYMAGRRIAWRDWQRREDYYPESVLLWLGVEARLRRLSAGRLGMDDFARRFFDTRQPGPALYGLDDVVATLDGLAHDDWRAALTRKLETHDAAEALDGLAAAGWRLVYDSVATESFRQEEADDGARNFAYSAGLKVKANGEVREVSWDGPAFRAGLAPGVRLLTVDGEAFSIDKLERAIAASATTPLQLEFQSGARRRVTGIAYRGALRYPHLERIPGTADYLTPLLAPRADTHRKG